MRRMYSLSVLGLMLLLTLTGCWNENTANCWMGDVTIHVLAERFQELPDGASEEQLSKRFTSVQYYLYHGENLYLQGTISDKAALDVPQLTLTFPKLAFGGYCLAIVGNTSGDDVLDISAPMNMKIEYPGTKQTKDFFVSCYEFTVDCDCGMEDFVKLYRTQGVAQFELKNLPDNITEIEVGINRLGQSCRVDTVYQGEIQVSHRINVADAQSGDWTSFVFGAFPTIADGQSEVFLKLYADGDPLFMVYEKKIAELSLLRNQLYKFEADFNHDISGDVGFTVTVNPDWDGVGGGDVPVE